MKAKVTEEFPGRPDHEVLTRPIKVGEIVTGDLARLAVERGAAAELTDSAEKTGEHDGLPDLEKLTLDKLKAVAADRNIDLGEAEKKADIIAAIRASRIE